MSSAPAIAADDAVVTNMLGRAAGIKLNLITFGGSGPALLAALGGHVEAVSQTPEWKEQVDAGNLRLLVCWNDKRIPFYPQVPTFKEKGYDFSVQANIIILAPAGIPPDVVEILSKAFRQAAETDEVKQVIQNLGYPLEIKTSAELVAMIKKDYELNGKIFKALSLGIYKK